MQAGPLGSLQSAVSEHTRWLEVNCGSQLDYYTRFVAERGAMQGKRSGTEQLECVQS